MEGNYKHYISMDLQFFAEEKTEEATQKKKQEAREKGQIPRSRDLTSSILLLLTFLSLGLASGYFVENVSEFMVQMLGGFSQVDFTEQGIAKLFRVAISVFMRSVAPIFAVSFIAALLGTYLQVGNLFSAKVMEFDISKMDPIKGFKKMVSKRSAFELLKTLGKVFLVGGAIYLILKDEIGGIPHLLELPMYDGIAYIADSAISLGVKVAIVLVAIGLLDYAFQWKQHQEDIKMSKQEVKEELKQTEGNPEIKSRQREIQRAAARRRMMKDIPNADVIVVNPTHYAVALKYETSDSDAPRVVAKGKGHIAQKIRDIAKEHNIPIVQNVEVARTLYKTTEIGDVIPESLYKAVAEILAYIYRLKNRR